MRFLNRSDEMHRLGGVLSRSGAFAVVRGRRQIGGSRLLTFMRHARGPVRDLPRVTRGEPL